MNRIQSITVLAICCLSHLSFQAQEGVGDSLVLGFEEYLGQVKKYHPVAKQANLQIDIGQANLMRARGSFDPKVEVDFDRKEFKGTEYYDRLNAVFKIPTWYGIELKGTFAQNDGDFLNPAESLPDNGLYSAGVSMSLGQGLWINERMATLKQAKLFRDQVAADRDLLVNQILFEASMTYFDWVRAYQDERVYRRFLANAELRYQGIRQSALAGDIAAIDTVEAGIALKNRALGHEQAKLKLLQAGLDVSNFLWLQDNLPVELRAGVVPEIDLNATIDSVFDLLDSSIDSFDLEDHPKLRSLRYKIEGLAVEKRLKANKLLPEIDLEYNLLTETPEYIDSFQTEAYKGGVRFRLPLFLRKERGDLKLAKFKLRDAQFDRDNTMVQIQNKVLALYSELESYETQTALLREIVEDYGTMLAAEERKFSFGESSLFLINTRESSLIEAELKQNDLRNKFFKSKAKLFNSLAITPNDI